MTDISVTDEELRTEIANILKDADLLKTSTKKVIKKLESTFKTSLTSRKEIIDKMVLDYINSMSSEEEEEEEDEKVEVKEEEEEKEEEEPPKRKRSTRSDNNEKEAPKKSTKRSKKNASNDEGGGRGKSSGYTRAYKLSPALSELMGAEEMSRHEVVKRMWAIIKEKKMYDPNNKQFTICDDALYKVIGTKRFRTFGMMKYLKSHFIDQ